MGVERWRPKQEVSEQEQRMLLRMKRTGKLFAFLRRHRHELITDRRERARRRCRLG